VFTSEALKRDGISLGLEKAVRSLPRPLYLHFDLDVTDATEMPALAGMSAGVHHPGGLTHLEVSSLCDGLAALPLAGMDISLYDPNLDPDRKHARTIIELVRKIFPY
jgi:arginase